MISIVTLKQALEIANRFDGVISIEDVGQQDVLRVSGDRQLVLQFDDTDASTVTGPTADHIASALEFGRRIGDERLLIHCVFGQARSPALALAIIADALGPGAEKIAVERLLENCEMTMPGGLVGPNLMVLRLADEILQRQGVLVAAWMAYEEGREDLARFRFLRGMATSLPYDMDF